MSVLAKTPLTAAFGAYDRTLALLEPGSLADELDLRIEFDEPSVIFRRMLEQRAFDIAEMSGAAYLHLLTQPHCPFVGIPVFPSRAFRHSMVHVKPGARISQPADLNGGTVVVREWGMTAVLWAVGILQDDYGFDFRSVTWITEKPARAAIAFPDSVKHRMMNKGESVAGLLASGEADAAFVFDVQSPHDCLAPASQCLFADFGNEERRYFQRTGIHPPMHTVVVDRRRFEQFPALPKTLYTVMSRAKALAASRLLERGTNSAMLPYLTHAMDETLKVFGQDWWPYGIEANRSCLERMCRYAFQQGLTPRQLNIHEVFPECAWV